MVYQIIYPKINSKKIVKTLVLIYQNTNSKNLNF